MLLWLKLLTFIWLAQFFFRGVRAIYRGSNDTANFLYPTHLLFCGVPLILDVAFGSPAYAMFPGFFLSSNDLSTNIIYCAYVSFCPVVWETVGKSRLPHLVRSSSKSTDLRRPSCVVSILLFGIVVLPLLLVLLSPDPCMYLSYVPQHRLATNPMDSMLYHVFVSKACLGSIVAAAALLMRTRNITFELLRVIPILATVCWINGKRNAVAFSITLCLYAVWKRGSLRGSRLVIVGGLCGLCFMCFSIYYQGSLRFSEEFVERRGTDFWYENFRVDYGRDDVIRLAIYAELHPDEINVVDYRGESVISFLTLGIPRSFWPGKPDPYGRKMMEEAMFGVPKGGGAMTTSVLDESISNFGWFGVFVGPLIIAFVCRVGDLSKTVTMRALTVLVVTCLQVVHVGPWYLAALAWIFLAVSELFQSSSHPISARRSGVVPHAAALYHR